MMQAWYFLQGRIAREEKQYDMAVDFYEKGEALLAYTSPAHFWYLEELGRTAALAGDWERAREEFLKLTRLDAGKLEYGDIYVEAFYHLGKISEELGDIEAAVRNYEKFLDLWKNADPDLPEVNDARERLGRLRTH